MSFITAHILIIHLLNTGEISFGTERNLCPHKPLQANWVSPEKLLVFSGLIRHRLLFDTNNIKALQYALPPLHS
jgi:hypothetical protein